MNTFLTYLNKLKQDDLNSLAASCAYFIIVCCFPTLILLLSFMKYTPISMILINAFLTTIPDTFQDFFYDSVNALYQRSSIALLSFSAITTLWTCGKSFHAISRSLNQIYGFENRTYLLGRIFSSFCAFLFVYFIIIFFIIITLGKSLSISFLDTLLANQSFLLFLFATTIISMIYTFVPKRHHSLISQFPGTLFCVSGWFLFSKFYNIYSAFTQNYSLLYGSLATIILMMLLLYCYLYIFLLGAELNAFLEDISFNTIFRWLRRHKRKK